MSKFFNKNYGKILKKLPSTSSLQSSKTLVTLGLLFYWSVILVGTFFNFN